MKVDKRIFTITEEQRSYLIELVTKKRNALIHSGEPTKGCDNVLGALIGAKHVNGQRLIKLLDVDWRYLVIRIMYDERQRQLEAGEPVGKSAELTLHIMRAEQRTERYKPHREDCVQFSR